MDPFIEICEYAKKLEKLDSLNLKQKCCSGIQNKNIFMIFHSLQSFQNSNFFSLKFESCKDIETDSLVELASNLPKLSNLKTLEVNLSDALEKVSNEGILSLLECLFECHKLLKLELNFSNSVKITDACLDKLVFSLHGLRDLNHLIISFKIAWERSINQNSSLYSSEIHQDKKNGALLWDFESEYGNKLILARWNLALLCDFESEYGNKLFWREDLTYWLN